jgi:RNA polymerase sigma-70 factor (ECF subfamily)
MAPTTTFTEAKLIADLQRHDAHALAELYDRYGRLVHSLILRAVHDVGIAEDLVQETFLRVWNRVQGFDGRKGSIGPWLLAIARNRAIDYLRSVRNRERHTVEFDETDHPPAYTDTENDMVASDRGRRVRAAMQRLLPNHLRAIELTYFEGLSHLEAAERMGQPLGTVKSWVRMALQNLRQELTPRPALAPALACVSVRQRGGRR